MDQETEMKKTLLEQLSESGTNLMMSIISNQLDEKSNRDIH